MKARRTGGVRVFVVPTGKGGRLRPIKGGRVPAAGAFSPALEAFIRGRASSWGVSRSAVVVSMCAFAAGFDREDA